ncbi:ataxin-2 homolog [Drosophila bipectinata]|uniref:ataxin-2 homolog n=1 Tax=Drosophila bipectinata TaxID=42026 RepID=UPI001C8A38A4|nr:ataxin-2 homolog [Drosophila bipectinata]
MRIHILVLTLLLGLAFAHAVDAEVKSDGSASIGIKAVADNKSSASIPLKSEATKDKRQVSGKETPLYPNHRSSEVSASGNDDPEDGQETIYGSKPNQFIIRPIAPHQHQQHESHQEPQLRNYASANSRPHAAQLLEQSQEVQHYVYLQDIMRHHQPKALVATGQGKGAASAPKKSATPVAEEEQEQEQEAEQRYTVSIQPQAQQGPRPRQYQGVSPYQLPLPLPAPQHQPLKQQQQPIPQQPYQIIPEEQFLKILEEELQARAYHEQLRQQQQHHQQPQVGQQVGPQPKNLPLHSTAATHKVLQQAEPVLGLGGYRERLASEQDLGAPTYSHPRSGGPKYLPLPQAQRAPEDEESQQQQQPHRLQLHKADPHQGLHGLPPQIAYYQPQISYKTLPNHPLAKSSLESEIEKLLEANKPGQALAYVDSSSEQATVLRQPTQPQHPPPPSSHPALRQPKAYLASTPNSLLDANNQPFVPSLFKFSNFQQPTPIYPTPESKRLGPVVYPTQQANLPQPSQYYYQESAPTAAPKSHPIPKQYHRNKHYKLASPGKALLYADFERNQAPSQLPPPPSPANFYPSPPDPIKHAQRAVAVTPTALPLHAEYPSPAPSQSSIYVSQGTGIATPSRVTPTSAPVPKLRTLDEVKQLNLPPPNGKPLTQAEFQALVDAGYPVKAVPVPVPVPFEQYVKDHPEYRNHPPVDYAHLMRLATRQLAAHQQHRSLVAPSEPSVKILSTPSAGELQHHQQQTATGIGGGSVTYLQPIERQSHPHAHTHALQKRRPRDEQDTAIAGSEPKTADSLVEAQPTKTNSH